VTYYICHRIFGKNRILSINTVGCYAIVFAHKGAAVKPKTNLVRNFIYTLIVLAVLSAFYVVAGTRAKKPQEVNISEITRELSAGNIKQIDIDGNKILAEKNDGTALLTYKEEDANLSDYGITPDKVSIDVRNPNRGDFWSSALSLLVPLLLFGGAIWFMLRSAQGANGRAMSFGKSTARLFVPGAKRTTFEDVAGLEEPKQELFEVVEFLKQPEKFKKVGAEIPKGVLLIGPAGVGKTLLARAVAGEAGVPFFTISASEFVEMFVGVGAARVRDLFSKAKRNAPAVLFIDEMDAVGRQRGSGMGGSHDEREQTLNQILVEMDGFEPNQGVIVLAATNRPDVLDPALLRPGRFDRKVVLDNPDRKERAMILGIHGRNKPLADDVDLEKVAGATIGMSGAELKNIMNEAAILTARDDKKQITQNHLNLAIEKVMIGPERKSHILSPKEKEITAIHEGGHAIVGHVLPFSDPIHKISVVSRGMAAGYTWSMPQEDVHMHPKQKFLDDLASLLGGRVAEKLMFGEITTGAENDLQRATSLARRMVTQYGMSDKLGPMTYGERSQQMFMGRDWSQESRSYSNEVAAQIDAEIKELITDAYKRAEEILTKHKKMLQALSDRLIKEETVEGDEFEKMFEEITGEKVKRENPVPVIK
jgi:cell division protease FtsH